MAVKAVKAVKAIKAAKAVKGPIKAVKANIDRRPVLSLQADNSLTPPKNRNVSFELSWSMLQSFALRTRRSIEVCERS